MTQSDWRSYLMRLPTSIAPEKLRDERILVTGGSGFIGTNIVDYYHRWGAKVLNIDIHEPRNTEHAHLWRKVDICDAASLLAEVSEFKPSAVFHLAARADLLGKSAEDYPENSLGVSNVISTLKTLQNRPRLIVASSRMVCDLTHIPQSDTDYSASNPYGESKVLTEIVTRRDAGNSVPWILVRPTGIWGPWFGVPYRNFFDAIAHRYYMHPRGFRTRKAYGFVGNLVFQLDRLMYGASPDVDGKTYYICDDPIEILSWAQMIADQMRVRRPIQVPYRLLLLAAKAGDLLQRMGVRHAPLTSFRLANLTTDMVFDRMLASQVTGNGPYSIAEGTSVTFDWLTEGYPKFQYGSE